MSDESSVTSHASRVAAGKPRVTRQMFPVTGHASRVTRICPPPRAIWNPKPAIRDSRPATRDPRPRTLGFTLFELVVVIIVVSVVGTLFLHRLRLYQEMAERVAMESTVRLIKTGLQIRLAELIIENRQGEAAQLETEDPTQWLDVRPRNYAGDYRASPAPGNWYFDAQRKQLVYVVTTGDRLEIDTDRRNRELRFRARLLKDRLNVGGAMVDSVTGVTVVPVQPFRWSRGESTTIVA